MHVTDKRSWRKSSRSVRENCVEVAFLPTDVALRDSKHLGGPILRVSHNAFRAFLRKLR
ncbi:DUF397 domain-containing protein [Saccharopolyspora erythraea]|uniref:DUF397 domain-containing protein n=1 Tax=Saccharopolyspora erythraea TaxID=1836 RepID=UPI001BACAF74|nr:DUF397 domain-containing protein [Saccharopolyspora erythraea]QUH02837.1 DUF397 domain-containing protein [Saccharopolyspora erythraea]